MFPTILRGLGIKMTDEQIAMLEVMLPQIPAKAAELITVVNFELQRNDRRLRVIEDKLNVILDKLEAASHGIDTNTIPDVSRRNQPTGTDSSDSQWINGSNGPCD